MSTALGSLAVMSVYAPPDSAVNVGMWSSIIQRSLGCDFLYFCGDFNAHSPLWGARYSNFQGRELCSAVLDHGLTPLNDSVPTFLAATGRSSGNLDLVFLTSSRIGVASVWVTEDTLGSDHFLVLGDLEVSPRYARSTSNRFNTKNADWIRFRELVDDGLPGIDMAPDSCSDAAVLYSRFFDLITRVLERCGAYRPSSLPGKRKSQHLGPGSGSQGSLQCGPLGRPCAAAHRAGCARKDCKFYEFPNHEENTVFLVC